MKIIILLLTLMSFSASATIIPASYSGIIDSGDSLWSYTDANLALDDSGFDMLFEYGQFNTSDHSFGMYQFDAGTDSIVNMLQIFNFGDSNDSNVVWDFSGNSVATRYGSASLDYSQFGFYFVSDGDTFYSQSQFNQGGQDLFGFYWETDPFTDTNLYIYASDNDSGNNYDYMYVSANDVRQIGVTGINVRVPEPGTIILFSLALIGLATRRKFK